ncbi:MAG: TetR/AcrR family transcriptional regulator [Actinobacteria bacterium]|nr:TetR/AcrR family transcriptional regulator [Actinomycetota bacterium]
MSVDDGVATRQNQRDHILDVALRLMSQRGAKGTSMRRLAAACDLQVAAIYHYFESKDALLAAVVAERHYGTRMAESFPIDPAAPPEDRLTTLFLHVWNGALEEQAIWRLVLGEGMQGEPAVMSVGRDLLDLIEPATTGWIRQFLPEVADPEAVAHLMVGQLLVGFVRAVFSDDDPTTIGADCVVPLLGVVFS